LVIRTDAADDQLTFTGGAAPSISGAVLVKSGLGTLLANGGRGVQLSGQLFVNGGTFEVNSGIAQTIGTGGTMTDATDVSINAGATLKINMGTAFTGQTFSGVISGGGNLINASKVLTLSGANLFSGTTTVTGGLLTLGNAIALQNSTLDTANSPASSSPTTGLKTTMTTLTFGGLSGDKDFASLFNAANGYTTVTALTLNPSAGASPSYSGAIADGASGMTLTKTGAGTQTLSGANSYSGATTISAGTLKLGANNVLPSTAVSIGTAILDADIRTDTVGTLDVTGAAVINLGAGGTLAFANSRAINSGTWAGTLKISGSFVSGASIKFGTDNTGLTPAQLARISVPGVPTLMLNSNGYLSEVKGTLVSFF
jgi:autotransporter-associated beta strand protein